MARLRRGRSDRPRVATAHRVAGAAFRLSLAYALVAGIWAVERALQGGSLWGPLHAFLAGSVLLAISGATQLFVITWAAAAPPPAWLSGAQRWTLAGGTALVLVGREWSLPAVASAGAAGVVLSLALLAACLVVAVRASLLRRFDWPARFYLLAVGAGLAGVTLGLLMVAGVVSMGAARAPHLHLNLVGLVGLTIVGTLPTLLPTFAHHRMVSGREVVAAWWLGLAGMAAYLAGMVEPSLLAAGDLLVLVAGLSVLAGMARLGTTRIRRAGLPFAMVATGVLWLAAWLAVDALILVGALPPVLGARWIGVGVLGVAQVLLGAFSYLLPVILGPRTGHGPSLERMLALPWLPWGTSTAGITVLALGAPAALVTPPLAVWGLDFARRVVGLLAARRRTTPDPGR